MIYKWADYFHRYSQIVNYMLTYSATVTWDYGREHIRPNSVQITASSYLRSSFGP